MHFPFNFCAISNLEKWTRTRFQFTMTGLPARVLIKITWYGVVFCDEKEEKDFFFCLEGRGKKARGGCRCRGRRMEDRILREKVAGERELWLISCSDRFFSPLVTGDRFISFFSNCSVLFD